MMTKGILLGFIFRSVLYGVLIGLSIYAGIEGVKYHFDKVRDPGKLEIRGIEAEAICIMKEPLSVEYFGDHVRISAINCNGDIVSWAFPHPKKRGNPV